MSETLSLPSILKVNQALAVLVLADGTVFSGVSVGAEGSTVGEVVFNTSMTGYQEILTDPSYMGQLVTLTYPHIGNYGVNDEDVESAAVQAAGLIVRNVPLLASNFRHSSDLTTYLQKENTVAIAEIDTRQLTRHVRENGAQNGCIVALKQGEAITDAVIEQAQQKAQNTATMAGQDLACKATTAQQHAWEQTTWKLADDLNEVEETGYGVCVAPTHHVVVYDFGVKHNILRMLAQRGCKVTVVPAQTPVADVLALQPDGVMLSNGPGDPEPCGYAIEAVKKLMESKVPVFGICLGHQILALASGATTFKMKFGHHGANHPVLDIDSGKVAITSQNHGFAVDESKLPDTLRVTHRSLFDQTVQGIARTDVPAFSFQGHPEASPGPNDMSELFDRFVELITETQAEVAA